MEWIFDFADADGVRARRIFGKPHEIVHARTTAQVLPALARVDRALAAGLYVAGYLGYDAAPAFDTACVVRGGGTIPLLVFGIFDAPVIAAVPELPRSEKRAPLHSPWQPDTDEAGYCSQVEHIRSAIRAGDAYQVNHTIRMRAQLLGEARSYYEQLRAAQDSDYCAFLDLETFQVLSASPELFFHWREGLLTARPMKGTAPRGRWAAEDEARASALYESQKDRAENLMIVDLLRNDLARLSQPGGVQVPKLFAIERYPTLFQMTSTVTAQTRAGLQLSDVFAALFPCGSITGAPKYQAMKMIATLEGTPRGVYCGAIGFAGPAGATFNVAIRTVSVEGAAGAMSCGVGGGITWPSDAHAEFVEAMNKAQFLSRAPARFDLFETLLLENATYLLRWRHLERIRRSAAALGFRADDAVWEALDAALYSYAAAHPSGRHRVRLVLTRQGAVRVEGSALATPDAEPLTIALAREPVLRADPFLYHKTTQRALYEGHLAAHPDAFDVLLWNEDGEVTEFTRGNVLVEIDGRRFTPPLSSGLLAGTMRADLLERGTIEERVIRLPELAHADRVWFINSVRGTLATVLASDDLQRAGVRDQWRTLKGTVG